MLKVGWFGCDLGVIWVWYVSATAEKKWEKRCYSKLVNGYAIIVRQRMGQIFKFLSSENKSTHSWTLSSEDLSSYF